MGGRERLIQPPETQNLFVGISIFIGLLWMLSALRRCYSVMQLRSSLGTQRLVAIRGAGRRVRIFRLLGRNYLQRALARNHLQALVHTRQAYPPKTMPCSLLLATPRASGGVKAVLQATEGSSANACADAGGGGVEGVQEGAGVGGGDDGMLVGLTLQMDCRVACTVELLWNVDLTLLGTEMNVDRKLPLLPASSRPGGSRAGDRSSIDLSGDAVNNAVTLGMGRRRRWRGTDSSPGGGGTGRPLTFLPAIASAVRWVAAPFSRVLSGSGRRVSGEGGTESVIVAENDEESGVWARADAESAGGGTRGTLAPGPGRRKSAILAGGSARLGNGSGTVSRSGTREGGGGWGRSGGGGGGNGDGARAGTGWGKRTAPREMSGGHRSEFRTSANECYFRVCNDSGTEGGGEARAVVSGATATAIDGGAGGRRWPSVRDSVPAGRCSLAIVIRENGGTGETGEGGGCRHRPTHRVTRQVLLVQLTERIRGQEGGELQAPSAQVLRHLVAISKGGDEDTEAIYSFSEVFGAGDEVGGTHALGNDNDNQDDGANEREQEQDLPEECVICLTDPKDTLLLPCRHLCVCSECFRHVDKCPVCRSAFDNYIVIESADGPSASAHGPQPSSSAAAEVVDSAGGSNAPVVAGPARPTGGIFAVSRRQGIGSVGAV